jgi:hypothetical protein
VNGSTVATDELLLPHTPPVAALLSVVTLPGQTLVIPVIGGGNGSTEIEVVAIQPVGKVYVMNASGAALTPVTTPVTGLTVATSELLLVHTPPTVVSLRLVV